MPKFGQARVLSPEQEMYLFEVIKKHRYPEKNRAIMMMSFRLGLRVQEIAYLQIKEVAQLNSEGTDFKLHEIMTLPAVYTKGSRAITRYRGENYYKRRAVTFSIDYFDRVVREIELLVKAGIDITPEQFYPPIKKQRGKSRNLPMVDGELRSAIADYIYLRIENEGSLESTAPLFITQLGGPYRPDTLQTHMTLVLSEWAGFEKATSHSGRRSLITNIIHYQKKSIRVAQKIAGHVNPATTMSYEEPPDNEIVDALKNLHPHDAH